MTGRRLVRRAATSSGCSTPDGRLIDTASLSAGDEALGVEESRNSPPRGEVDDEQGESSSRRTWQTEETEMG